MYVCLCMYIAREGGGTGAGWWWCVAHDATCCKVGGILCGCIWREVGQIACVAPEHRSRLYGYRVIECGAQLGAQVVDFVCVCLV